MALQGDVERYEEWRSSFSMAEEGVHTFRQLDKLRRIDNIVWNDSNGLTADEKLSKISGVLAE